tara:strand:- start:63 stop:518 length:456 start_codon:yes stop_codon:yes gene_type:complete
MSCTDDYVGIIDNDVIVPQNWLPACMAIANLKGVAVCGVLVEDIQDNAILSIHKGVETPDFIHPRLIGGACLVWNRRKLGKHGCFWGGAGVYGHEDCEFTRRVGAKVGRVVALTGRGYCIDKGNMKEYREWKTKCHDDSINTASTHIRGLL